MRWDLRHVLQAWLLVKNFKILLKEDNLPEKMSVLCLGTHLWMAVYLVGLDSALGLERCR